MSSTKLPAALRAVADLIEQAYTQHAAGRPEHPLTPILDVVVDCDTVTGVPLVVFEPGLLGTYEWANLLGLRPCHICDLSGEVRFDGELNDALLVRVQWVPDGPAARQHSLLEPAAAAPLHLPEVAAIEATQVIDPVSRQAVAA